MYDPYNFAFVYFLLFFASFFVLFAIAKKYEPLRKAWIVYSVAYCLHGIFFLGIWMSRPTTFPVYKSRAEQINAIETFDDAKHELNKQRVEIESLTNDIDQLNRSFDVFLWVLILVGPMLYYNLIKYNLDIERLSGKRMGSFD